MAQGLNYNQEVESRHAAGNSLAAKGNLDAAVLELSAARYKSLEVYATDDPTGEVHELRLRRDMAALDAQQIVADVRPTFPLNQQQAVELQAIVHGLGAVQSKLADFALFATAHKAAKEHLHSETGFADIWRARINIAMAVLSARAGLSVEYRLAAHKDLERAQPHILAGSNHYFKAMLFGHFARWQVLDGGDPRPYLWASSKWAVTSVVVDKHNFFKSLRAFSQLAGDDTPERIERAIRSGRM